MHGYLTGFLYLWQASSLSGRSGKWRLPNSLVCFNVCGGNTKATKMSCFLLLEILQVWEMNKLCILGGCLVRIRRKEFSVSMKLEMGKLKMIAELWKTSGMGPLWGPAGWREDVAHSGNICLCRFGFWERFSFEHSSASSLERQPQNPSS